MRFGRCAERSGALMLRGPVGIADAWESEAQTTWVNASDARKQPWHVAMAVVRLRFSVVRLSHLLSDSFEQLLGSHDAFGSRHLTAFVFNADVALVASFSDNLHHLEVVSVSFVAIAIKVV